MADRFFEILCRNRESFVSRTFFSDEDVGFFCQRLIAGEAVSGQTVLCKTPLCDLNCVQKYWQSSEQFCLLPVDWYAVSVFFFVQLRQGCGQAVTA
jgi:hypothetical protein